MHVMASLVVQTTFNLYGSTWMEKILHVLCTVIYAVIILIYNDTRSSKHVALFIGVRTECVCVCGGGGGGGCGGDR